MDPLTVKLLILLGIILLSAIIFLIPLRRDRSREKRMVDDSPILKGLHYILTDHTDRAIEELIKAVRINSDTIETYVALGNLFRSKGEIERAILIRQSIILRPHLSEDIKRQAFFDMALDYIKGGLFSRAVEILEELLKKDPKDTKALSQLERVYEEMKDWQKAFETQQRLDKIKGSNSQNILAHLRTEEGKEKAAEGDFNTAKNLFQKAIHIDPDCIDAYLHLGDLYVIKGDLSKALDSWKKLLKRHPEAISLVLKRMDQIFFQFKDIEPVGSFLKELTVEYNFPVAHLSLARYLLNQGDTQGAIKELRQAIRLKPTYIEARKELGQILIKEDREQEALEEFKQLLKYLHLPPKRYQCQNCGFETSELHWKCPRCRKWDTFAL